MKHYILVNPISGNKKGLKRGIIVKKLLKKYNIKVLPKAIKIVNIT